MQLLLRHRFLLILLFITVAGAFLRFYNLSWGEPYYFHPDERNIAASVSQLSFPDKMNPHFFAYGSLPIYTIYFSGVYSNIFSGNTTPLVSFEQAIIISRVYSAFFATLLIPLLYVIGKRLLDEKAGILTAFFAVFLTGFLQFAHFGTFEMWLTFGSVLLFFASLLLLKTRNSRNLLLMSLFFGILCATKISSLAIGILPIGLLLFTNREAIRKKQFLPFLKEAAIFTMVSVIIFIVTNPFVFLDTPSFKNSLQYESSLALGTLPVFYTGEFRGTLPVLYPLRYVFPFLLNPLLAFVSIPALIIVTLATFRKRNVSYFLLLGFFFVLFFSQAFLFVKWTRYYVPTLPFLLLIIGTAVSLLSEKKKSRVSRLTPLFSYLLMSVTALFGIAYTITAFVEPDTRLQAQAAAEKIIPPDTQIISEVYDLGITPLNNRFQNITLYDFYSLDDGNENRVSPETIAGGFDYIILPSQRIMKVRLTNSQAFLNGHAFYRQLFDGTLGYHMVYQTPCSLWCHITYLSDPIYMYEGTASVFDRPTVTLFQKR